MAAGRGIIHSEIPQQESGRMHGFQLWLNLPAKEKMKPAAYRDICPEEIPEVHLKNGGKVRAVAGKLEMEGQRLSGPIQGGTTAPLFWDIHLPAGATFAHAIPAGHTAFIYAYEGRVGIGGDTRQSQLMPQVAGELTDGDFVIINALNQPAAFLLVAAKPLHEPIAQYGPFVMNTQDEIVQAITDYQTGQLTSPAPRP